MMEGGPMGMLEYGGPPQGRITRYGGGNQQAIITNTTVEVVVPNSLVPSIYGEDGIRQALAKAMEAKRLLFTVM